MTKLLDTIDGPADLKRLSSGELRRLAQELREELVRTVTVSGGHLASNLGVVELTIAIHRVFESPRDKIIWDVGHQSYIHKILTGRRERFATIRQLNGLSGFTDRNESVHDPFGSGHASTSISAALGIATARDLKGEDFSVIAVIGDGAMTGGMAFEALNHAGHMRITKFIVILNDNQMSISPTVGAIARILNQFWLDERLKRAETRAERILSKSTLGRQMLQLGRQLKRSFKGFTLPPAKLWEELGFTYMGPFNGHDITELETALISARSHQNDKPVFMHVITKKGKGYPPAEADAVRYHGVTSVCGRQTTPTFSEVFAATLHDIMARDPRVVVITAAMAEGNCLGTVARDFPDRFFDVGICEEHATTFAAGLATQGLRPVVAIYSTFLQRAIDQIIHDVCLQDLPVVFAIDRAGIVGEDGKTHQGLFDLSYLTMVPNLVVSAPKDGDELRNLLYTATRIEHPMAIRYPRGNTQLSCPPGEFKELPVGRAEVLRHGKDLTVLAVGTMSYAALDAAISLAQLGIEAAVVNVRYVKPLDLELISRLSQLSRRVLTVEENVLTGGFGSTVTQLLHSAGLDNIRIRSMGINDQYVEHGPQNVLRSKFGLDASGITARVFEHFPELNLVTKEGSFTMVVR